ncbi:MAG: hypothetical protein ABFD50_16850 [Smithella sp.]
MITTKNELRKAIPGVRFCGQTRTVCVPKSQVTPQTKEILDDFCKSMDANNRSAVWVKDFITRKPKLKWVKKPAYKWKENSWLN